MVINPSVSSVCKCIAGENYTHAIATVYLLIPFSMLVLFDTFPPGALDKLKFPWVHMIERRWERTLFSEKINRIKITLFSRELKMDRTKSFQIEN